MKITIPRDQFYDELWSVLMKVIQYKYGVSYHRLSVACKEHDIPRPSSGYWAKTESGKKVKENVLRKGSPEVKTKGNTHFRWIVGQNQIAGNIEQQHF